MDLSAFTKPAPPVSTGPPLPESPSPAAPQEEQYVESVTPNGTGIRYSWAPRRWYKLARHIGDTFQEVPSVTTVLGVLDKSGPLTWWGMKVGVEGVRSLTRDQVLYEPHAYSVEELVDLLTEHKLTVNHVKDLAADRGVNVHGALEAWIERGEFPDPLNFQEHEQSYVKGLDAFIAAVDPALTLTECESELMVGSLQHSYAGRFDLVLTLSKPVEVVTRAYPKRPPKIEEIPAGRYLIDLKTRARANVYPSNYMQLEAYELAAVECGYQPTDHRAVLVVTPDGKYQLSINHDWTAEDFLTVRKTFAVVNERSVVQALRDELDAKDAA